MNSRSHTKIVCTIGPKTASVEEIRKLLDRGMSVARLNLSHGDLNYHSNAIDSIRTVEKETGHRIFIALDTRGPEFRVFCKTPLAIGEGDPVRIMRTADLRGTSNLERSVHHVGTDVDNFGFLKPGNAITFDDGKLCVLVEKVEPDTVVCRSLGTRLLQSNKRVCFPENPANRVFLDKDDTEGLHLGIQKNVDAVFLSFVERADDVFLARKLLRGRQIKIISKIESLAGVRNIDAIVEISDGVMIARGDLLNGVGVETMFSVQKLLIQARKTKPVIMATEMLCNMTREPTPLRSEIADIGYSVLDGCAAVMLSEETACGKYPSESVDVMRKVCMDAERFMGYCHENVRISGVGELGLLDLDGSKIYLVSLQNDCGVDREFMFRRGVYFTYL